MPEQWIGPILIGIAAIIFATVILWRTLLKSLIDLLHEVRDVRQENSRLYQENAKLIRVIRNDRLKWAKEKAQMQAQIDKLTGYLKHLVPHLRAQTEKIETLMAINQQYQRELKRTPSRSEGD